MSQPGILLINLGSPDSTSVPDVRRYLREFLMDARVLDAPWPIRFAVVHGAILPFRPRQSAEAYEKIWTPEGSPLVVTSRRVRQLLAEATGLPVELAMRYRLPSAAEALTKLSRQGVTEVAVIPLFPHFAMSSFETAVLHVADQARRVAPGLQLRNAAPYYEDPAYVDALVASARPYLEQPHDHLIFSFHGIPERHLRKSDTTGRHCLSSPDCCRQPSPAHATCYRAQCFRTAEAFASRIDLPSWSISFQSRLGRDPWLKPYTDLEVERFGREGRKRLLVICPAFVSDCLETLEEIGMRAKETFLEAGGEDLRLIPCLNTHPDWIQALAGIARRTLAGTP